MKRTKKHTFLDAWREIDLGHLLLERGEDLSREGLKDTPKRVRAMWEELLDGYLQDPEELLSKTFEDYTSGLQICKDIFFTSLCEHHLAVIHGTVDIGYISDGRVVGLSKLPRLVDCFAHRLQIQERFVNQIADAIMTFVKPKGVIVMATATHFCCVGRGVRRQNMTFATHSQRGEIDAQLYELLWKR